MDQQSDSKSPHKTLNLARLLGPLKPLVQEDVPSDQIDKQKPSRLQELRRVNNEVSTALVFFLAGTGHSVLE
jgi:hypothetical protein